MRLFIKKNFKYIIILLIILSIFNFCYHRYIYYEKYDNYYITNATIISKENITDNSITYLAKIGDKFFSKKILLKITIDESDEIVSNKKEELFFNRFGNLKYNDVVYVNNNIYPTTKLNNDYEFDYKEYLASRSIVGQIYVNEVEYIYSKKDVLNVLYNYKEEFDSYIDNNMLSHAPLFKTIIYGNDLDLSSNIVDMFVSVGQSITLSVSGSNIFSIYLIISSILSYVNKYLKLDNKKFKVLKNAICICFYLAYYVFCDYKISILRVVVMYILASIFNTFSAKIYTMKKLILSIIVIFFINPYVIVSVSFILGTVANIGIYTLNNKIKKYINFKLFKRGYESVGKYAVKHKRSLRETVVIGIVNCICFYISCNIYILPVQAYYFNYFNLTAVISNLFITTLYFYEVFIGTLLMLLFKIPVISNILMFLSNIITFLIYNIVESLTNVTIEFNLASPSIITIVLYYSLVIIVSNKDYVVNLVKNLFKNKKTSNYFKRKKAKTIFNIGVLITFCIIIISYVYTSYFNSFVYHFNIGQGNCSILKDRSTVVVFDIGSVSSKNVDDIVLNYMKKKNIQDIDYLVISHFHADHINGLYALEEKILNKEMVIKNIIYTIPKNTLGYYEFIDFVDRYKINKIVVERGESLRLSDELLLEFLSPDIDSNIKSSDEVNSNSLVTLVSLYDTYHLFLGDATVESEEVIMDSLESNNRNRDVSKIKFKLENLTSYVVGHHGSKTSSGLDFLNFTNAKYYIISAKRTIFNHPSNEVISRFNSLDLKYIILEKDGGMFLNSF